MAKDFHVKLHISTFTRSYHQNCSLTQITQQWWLQVFFFLAQNKDHGFSFELLSMFGTINWKNKTNCHLKMPFLKPSKMVFYWIAFLLMASGTLEKYFSPFYLSLPDCILHLERDLRWRLKETSVESNEHKTDEWKQLIHDYVLGNTNWL